MREDACNAPAEAVDADQAIASELESESESEPKSDSDAVHASAADQHAKVPPRRTSASEPAEQSQQPSNN